MIQVDTQFFPGWIRKAITFSIDDGIVPNDEKFIKIVRPAGIKGTFNLCSHNMSYLTEEEYKEFYRGYEIANHTKYHPYVFADGEEYVIRDEPFDPETADPRFLYSAGVEHLYFVKKPQGWRKIADTKGYIEFIDACQKELEDVFGQGSVRSFVWPFDWQPNVAVEEHLKNMGYYGVRRSGARCAEGAFTLEENRMPWHYTANHTNLLEMAERYEQQEDDGTLKMFCFGLHSNDYENFSKWGELKTFAGKYGNRPRDYYYATVGEIFDYADAVKKLIISEDRVSNPTEFDLFIRIDGKNILIKAGTDYVLA